MTSLGHVRVWQHELGWGVIDSEVTPGGCWTHYASALGPGYRVLETGQEVRFGFETAEQDGYSFRAVEVWPAGQAPVRDEVAASGRSSAHRSTLTLTFDDEDETSQS